MQATAHGVSCAARIDDVCYTRIIDLDKNLLSVYDICDFDRRV